MGDTTQRIPKSVKRKIERHQRDDETFGEAAERIYDDLEIVTLELKEFQKLLEDEERRETFKDSIEKPAADIEYYPEHDEYPTEAPGDTSQYLVEQEDGSYREREDGEEPDALEFQYDDGYHVFLTAPYGMPAAYQAEIQIPEDKNMEFFNYLGSLHPEHGWIEDYSCRDNGYKLDTITLRMTDSGVQMPLYELERFVDQIRDLHAKQEVTTEMMKAKWDAAHDGKPEAEEVELD